MFNSALLAGIALSLLTAVAPSVADAQTPSNRTTLTVSQPIAQAVQTTAVPAEQLARQLPGTASYVPLALLLAFCSIITGLSMIAFRKPALLPVSSRS